jgi:glycosyltransferase involved in cell wall biosynthesis
VKRINILWVIDHVCYDGSLHGGGRLYWNVASQFDPNRFHILPCFLRSNDAVRKVFEKSPIPVRIFDKGKYDLTTLITFLRIIKREHIHVMHLHCYASSIFGRLAGFITGVPTIVHDYDTNIYFPYVWYLRLGDRVLARVTDGAIAASPKVRDFLTNRRKIDISKVRMMFHAIPIEKYNSIRDEKIAKMKESLGIKDHAGVVGTVTKLGPERGNEYLLRAACEVLKVSPDTHFVIVYKPTLYHRIPEAYQGISNIDDTATMKAELVDLAKKLGIERNIHFIESLDDPDDFVSICDFIVAPFLNDRFSSVHLLEAMAKGKPLIATDMGEQRDIIKNGVNGYLVRPGDTKELAEKILKLLASPEDLGQMSLRARAMSQQYSVDAYVQTLQQWYTELARIREARTED